MSGVGSSPALATCETSQVLLAGVSGGFPGVLPFRSDISLRDDMISCLPVYKYAFFLSRFFFSFQSLFFWNLLKRYIIYRIIDCVSMI